MRSSPRWVSPGDVHFHFPTKEHVLVDIEARQEELISEALGGFLATGPPLADALVKTIDPSPISRPDSR